MNACWTRCSLIPILLAAVCLPAAAHKPVVIDGGPTTAATAHEVPDPGVSYVGYHEATAPAPALWFVFEAEAGASLYLQLGVPELDRYRDLRPAMALLGPGLPAVDVPFDVPEGYGGWVFDTAGQNPVVFDEEFTGTVSWQFDAVRVNAPETARYYLVGYIPSDEDGKFWMAIGEEESFGLGDIITLPTTLIQVRQFHEVFPFGGLLGWALVILVLGFFGLIGLFLR